MKRVSENNNNAALGLQNYSSNGFVNQPVKASMVRGDFREVAMKNLNDDDALDHRGQAGRVSTPRLSNTNGQAMLAATAIKKSRKITIVKGITGDKTRTTYTLG